MQKVALVNEATLVESVKTMAGCEIWYTGHTQGRDGEVCN